MSILAIMWALGPKLLKHKKIEPKPKREVCQTCLKTIDSLPEENFALADQLSELNHDEYVNGPDSDIFPGGMG